MEAARKSLDTRSADSNILLALEKRPEGPDAENLQHGLAKLVLTLVQTVTDILEKQAIRRVEAGGLEDDQVEELGRTLMLLDEKMNELRDHFGLEPEDLNIDLGPLGRLL